MDVSLIVTDSKTNQANGVSFVKLQEVTSVIERLIPVWCPNYPTRLNHVSHLRLGQTKVWILRESRTIYRGEDSIRNIACAFVLREWSQVPAPIFNSSRDFIK